MKFLNRSANAVEYIRVKRLGALVRVIKAKHGKNVVEDWKVHIVVLSRVIAIRPDFDRLTKVAAIESKLLARALLLTPVTTTDSLFRLSYLKNCVSTDVTLAKFLQKVV